jgi:conjugative transposon TraN protein
MKTKTLILFSLLLSALQLEVLAQSYNGTLHKKDLKKVYVNEDISFHFVSPEPIQYVDISTSAIQGDIPIKNICRIKAVPDSLSSKNSNASLGVVTIVGQKYIAQYDIRLTSDQEYLETQTEILPVHTNPLDVGSPTLSANELKEFSLLAYRNKKRSYSISNTKHDITGSVSNIYTVDDYVILDITYINKSNLRFDLDRVKFTIKDEKILKATNVQEIEVEPVYQLYDVPSFKRRFRNIYVLEKFSIPGNKVLSIELTESQISGRRHILEVEYGDILNADTL